MSKTIRASKTFIIRHKQTKKVWTAVSGKSSWKAKNHASSAWANSDHRHTSEIEMTVLCPWNPERSLYPKFREQNVYECIELLPESDLKLQEACELLKECLDYVVTSNSSMVEGIEDFIKENYDV